MRLRRNAELAALAALAYVPFLLSAPGRVSADSKQDLYLDPGGFLARAVHLWDPHVGAGGVPHQNLGYLMPMGPWFWAFDVLGVPDWVAQRLWLGTLSLAAAIGARWLFRQLGVGRAGALAGALVYLLTPYQLAFTARMSVLLLPWAALPWLVGLAMRTTGRRGWRDPALLALVLVLAGGVNASSLVLVAVGPVLWVLLEVAREPARAAAIARGVLRVALLAGGVSLWWLVGLRLQGAYGLPVLQLTENVRTVAEASTPGDILRGLGNWFFYGRDRTGYSLDQAADYATNDVVVVLSYAVPFAGLATAFLVRWAHRTYFVLLVVVGTVIGVGAWPYDDPTPFGAVWKAFTSETSFGLALRNSPRIVPLVVLGWAGLLAAGVEAVPRDAWRRAGAGAVAVAALAGLLPVWQTGFLTDGMQRPEELPAHWQEAAAAIDAGDHRTRVLEIPGSSFAAYSWGTTVDPVTTGLVERHLLAREVLPAGTAGTANLLDAFDRRLQQGIFEPDALAAVARLLAAGTVVFRGDLERLGRFDTPSPAVVWDALRTGPPGTQLAATFGGTGDDGPPAVALLDVGGARDLVRVAPDDQPVVLAGDGDGIVDAAAAGLLDGRALLLAAAALDEAALAAALEAGAHVIVTDSNRRRIQTWFYSLRDTRGPTEAPGATVEDPTGYDFRLDPFPAADDDDRTVTVPVGGQVTATGGPGPERPEDRAAQAVDGDIATAWRVAGPVHGHHLTVRFDEPQSADSIRLVQPPPGPGERSLASVAVTVDGGPAIPVSLGPDSLTPAGQLVPLDAIGPVREVRVDLQTATIGTEGRVGLAEVRVGDAVVAESVRPPVDLLRRIGDDLDGHGLDIVLTRLRIDLPEGGRSDEEGRLDRTVELPVERTFAVTGIARPRTAGVLPAGAACRDDLVRIDGAAVPVAVEARGSTLELRGCGAVPLSAGWHRVESVSGTVTGLDVDRLVLASGPDDAPADIGPRGADAERAGTTIDAVDEDPTSVDVTATTDGEPFWLTLAQSHSDGWRIDVTGGSAGERQLVDGYANGWRISPTGPGELRIRLRWTPQRLVWAGLGLSAAAAGACLLILLRTRGSGGPVAALAAPPTLHPWAGGPRRPSGRELLAVVGVAGLALTIAPPGAAAVAAVAAVSGRSWPPLRAALAVLAAGAVVLARATSHHWVAWVAVVLLLADVVAEAAAHTEVRSRPGPA